MSDLLPWAQAFGHLRAITSRFGSEDVDAEASHDLLSWVMVHGSRPQYMDHACEYIRDCTTRYDSWELVVHGPLQLHTACAFLDWQPLVVASMYHPDEVEVSIQTQWGGVVDSLVYPRIKWEDLGLASERLTALDCAGVHLGPQTLESLMSQKLPALCDLSLGCTHMANLTGVKMFEWSVLNKLTSLSLCDNQLSDDFVDALLHSSLLEHIRVLDVSRNFIGFEKALALLEDPRARGLDIFVRSNHMAPDQQEYVNHLAHSLKSMSHLSQT